MRTARGFHLHLLLFRGHRRPIGKILGPAPAQLFRSRPGGLQSRQHEWGSGGLIDGCAQSCLMCISIVRPDAVDLSPWKIVLVALAQATQIPHQPRSTPIAATPKALVISLQEITISENPVRRASK